MGLTTLKYMSAVLGIRRRTRPMMVKISPKINTKKIKPI
jgi:dihydroorotate dehydrogenase